MEVDTVIIAVGQTADFRFFGPGMGFDTSSKAKLAADPVCLATPIPGVFAGGDLTTGPGSAVAMLRGNWHGQVLGSGSDAWKFWDEKRAGRISDEQWAEIEGGIARSFGTCMVMGTAATMMAIAEAVGLSLPGAS